MILRLACSAELGTGGAFAAPRRCRCREARQGVRPPTETTPPPEERRRFAQKGHEYLIEQLQFTGDESVGSSSNKIKLNFNHPCKELIWVVQPDQNVDYCSSLECGATLFSALGAQPFNYTDAVDVLPNAIHSNGINTKPTRCLHTHLTIPVLDTTRGCIA